MKPFGYNGTPRCDVCSKSSIDKSTTHNYYCATCNRIMCTACGCKEEAAYQSIAIVLAQIRDGTADEKTAAANQIKMLCNDDANKRRLTNAKGIEILVALARDGTDDGKTIALSALDRLASNDDVKTYIYNALDQAENTK